MGDYRNQLVTYRLVRRTARPGPAIDLARTIEAARCRSAPAQRDRREVRLKKGDISIGLIGAVLTLGTPQDVTLQELRVEMFMPADEGSEALLVKLGR